MGGHLAAETFGCASAALTSLLPAPHPCRGMVSKDVFQSHFWECYNSFCEKATADVGVPGYFRFLTLLGE